MYAAVLLLVWRGMLCERSWLYLAITISYNGISLIFKRLTIKVLIVDTKLLSETTVITFSNRSKRHSIINFPLHNNSHETKCNKVLFSLSA